EMEAGFLLGNNASKKSVLAAKVKNIEGKLLGKDGKPLKSCLKTTSLKFKQVNPVGKACSHSVDSVTMEKSNANSMNPSHVIPVSEAEVDDTMKPNPNTKLGSGFDGANKHEDVDGSLKQVHPKKVHVSALTNDEKVLGANVAIPIAMVEEISNKFANTLYGYFIGERLAFPIMEAYVKNLGKLGRPIMLDACTSDMWLNPWGRNSYACVLVELSSECDILENIVVAIHLPKGKGHYLETLDVEYEWWPPHCSACKIFDYEVEDFPSRVTKNCSDSLSKESGGRDGGIKPKKKGANKAANKQGFRFNKPNNFIYRPVSKQSTIIENTSKPNSNASPVSKEVVNGAIIKPNVFHEVPINDSSCPTNANGYYKDDVDLGQLKSNIEKLMDEDKVIEFNTNLVSDVLTNTKYVLVEVHGNDKGGLLEQFRKSREASSSKVNAMSDSDESEVEEVCMPEGIPGGGFLDDLEDDLDCFDGYEAQVYDLTEQEQAFCDRYVVPTGKDNVIVSAGRSKIIPAGRTILVLVVLCLLRVDSIVS
ncbi:hypothetical protein Tco_1413917, partial [Tanacetum coccineum]